VTSPSPFPSPQAATASLPPLPDLSSNSQSAGGEPPNALASILSGIAPVKSAVDQINQACASIIKSGSVPGAEQICGQIVAMATSLLPMAAQNAFQPAGAGGPQGGMTPMPPSPGGPPPIAGGPQG
jgi:hypothetical protein